MRFGEHVLTACNLPFSRRAAVDSQAAVIASASSLLNSLTAWVTSLPKEDLLPARARHVWRAGRDVRRPGSALPPTSPLLGVAGRDIHDGGYQEFLVHRIARCALSRSQSLKSLLELCQYSIRAISNGRLQKQKKQKRKITMTQTIDSTFERVERITHAWEQHAPEASFSGMTLQQFKDAIKPSLDVRTALTEIATRTAGLKAQRAVVDKNSRAVADRIVAGVRGDVTHGPDSPLWAAMGFVRLSDRSTGLTRKGRAQAPARNDNSEGQA